MAEGEGSPPWTDLRRFRSSIYAEVCTYFSGFGSRPSGQQTVISAPANISVAALHQLTGAIFSRRAPRQCQAAPPAAAPPWSARELGAMARLALSP